jgi:hypothetical protein
MKVFDISHITSTNKEEFESLIDHMIQDAKEDNLFVKDIKYSTSILQKGLTHFNGYSEYNIIEYSALIIFEK